MRRGISLEEEVLSFLRRAKCARSQDLVQLVIRGIPEGDHQAQLFWVDLHAAILHATCFRDDLDGRHGCG